MRNSSVHASDPNNTKLIHQKPHPTICLCILHIGSERRCTTHWPDHCIRRSKMNNSPLASALALASHPTICLCTLHIGSETHCTTHWLYQCTHCSKMNSNLWHLHSQSLR